MSVFNGVISLKICMLDVRPLSRRTDKKSETVKWFKRRFPKSYTLCLCLFLQTSSKNEILRVKSDSSYS